MEEDVIKMLKTKLPVQYLGPRKYPYYKYSDVVNQLNEAFRHDWSNEVRDFVVTDNEVVAVVIVRVGVVSHTQVGRAKIGKDRNGVILSIGNNYKSAVADGIKKCAELFGVSMFSESEEGEFEGTVPTASSPDPVLPPVSSSVTISTKTSPEKVLGPGMNLEVIRNLLGNSQGASGISAQSPASSARKSQVVQEAPFPTTGQDGTANDMQVGALHALSKRLGKAEEEVIKNGLQGSGKAVFSVLTKSEAIQLIKYLQETNSKNLIRV
ncbi:MAG TPA: hypothetical protein ENI23_13265 [bacterium]|nr:hypothetical protein [bacterium]